MEGPAFTLPYEMEAWAAMNVNVHQTKVQTQVDTGSDGPFCEKWQFFQGKTVRV